ncbi:MAG: hypothetical protein HQL47_03365 [Gammaproteobacteria bacterium]|nr:hypothetical protein [Gammaproteobacteria bacterium]
MISDEQLQAVSCWLQEHPAHQQNQQRLRQAFPELHFSFCLDDDVIADTPALSLPGFNLYLVDSSNHCLSLTSDARGASGLVVAELGEE